MKVREIMTHPLKLISYNPIVAQAAQLMEENHVNRLLVLDNDKAVDIFSIGDLARKIEDDHIINQILREISEPVNISYT